MKLDHRYTTARGHHTNLSLYGTDLPPDAPCIVYLHGFKGFKDWGFVPHLGESFASAGFRMLAMNFSHNGIGDNPVEFTELDRFRDNTYSLEVEEAREVVHAYHAGQLFGASPGAAMGLIGHSRGGGIALLACRDLPPVRALSTWASVSTFFRYSEEAVADWKARGVLDILNSRTGQVMPLGWQLYEDLIAHGQDQLNIQKAVRHLNIPLCIIHGDEDEAVSLDNAHDIFEWSDNNAVEIHEIEGAGHSFGAQQPFLGSNPLLEDALRHTLSFFTHHLKSTHA